MARLPVLGANDIIAQSQLPAHLNPTTMSTASTSDRARANHTGTQLSATISDFNEASQDAIASLLVAGTNVTLVYNDTANTLTISSTGGSGGTAFDPSVLQSTDANAFYNGTVYPTRATVTTDTNRRVRWVGPISVPPTIGGAYAISGFDVWEVTP